MYSNKQMQDFVKHTPLIPELESKARRMVITVLPAALRVVKPSLCEVDIGRIGFQENSL